MFIMPYNTINYSLYAPFGQGGSEDYLSLYMKIFLINFLN